MGCDLELYRIFYVVAKHLHMSKASEELFISQPAVSQSIKKLEEQLDVILFIRSNKGLMLTDEGSMLFGYIKPAIEMISSAENELTNYKKLNIGKIRIGISTTLSKLILMDSLQKFHSDYPNIKIDIVNDLTSNLINLLRSGLLDLVIINESTDDLQNLEVSVIKEIEHCFFANINNFGNLLNKEVSLKDLNKYSLILQKKEANTRKNLDAFALENKVILSPYMEVVSSELVTLFTTIGLGIGFSIKDFIVEDLKSKKLFEIKMKEKIPNSKIILIRNKNIILNSACKKFVSYL